MITEEKIKAVNSMLFVLVVIYIVFISLGLPDSLFGVSWPVVHTEFGISESFASVYSIIIGVCTGGVSFVSGKLIRKFGTSKVTLVSILVTALGLLAISLAPNIAVMVVASVILGYGAGAIDTGLNNFVSLHYKAQHMNWLHCFWGVGVTVSPLIMSVFLGESGTQWRQGYRVIALMQVAIALLVLFSLKKWKGIEKGDSADEGGEAASATLIEIIKMKGVPTGILTLGTYCSMEFMLGTWGASYAVNVFAVSPDVAAKWVSLYFGGIMVGRVISGFLSIRFKDKSLIRGGLIVSLLGIIVFALPLGTASLAGFFLIGMGFGPVFPSVLHSIPERHGATYSADITGYHMGGAYAIGFGVQLIYGFIATKITFCITPFVLIALAVLCYICNEITVRKTGT